MSRARTCIQCGRIVGSFHRVGCSNDPTGVGTVIDGQTQPVEAFKYHDVGARLKVIRFYLQKPRQAEFGEFMGGFSMPQISRAETGRSPPPVDLLIALNRDHGVNINWLLAGRGEMFLGREGHGH